MSQKLRPNLGFLRSDLFACGSGGMLPYFGTHTQGRKPSLSGWMASLASGIDVYSRINAALANDDENPAVDAQRRCRSQRERFSNP